MLKTAIITPCYNEQDRLDAKAFSEKVEADPGITFIFVNDGSTDDTPQILDQLSEADPERLRVLHLESNQGKARAVRHGFLEALTDAFDCIGYWDADLATPLSAIDVMLSVMQENEAQIVIGSRVKLMGRHIERNPVRHYVGRIFATFISIALRQAIYDTQCGAKIFRNSASLSEVFAQPFSVHWIFDVEIFARYALIAGRRGRASLDGLLIEVPLDEWRDVAGSKLKTRDLAIALVDMVTIFLRYLPKIYSSSKN